LSETEVEARLTLKERLNFPYLLANQILTFQKAILNQEYSEAEIREAITSFVHLIPEAWKDKKFRKEIKKAKITNKIDIRRDFCGVLPAKEYCEKQSIPIFKDQETFDYYKMFQACINLLNRRRMLVKIDPTQEFSHFELEKIAENETRKDSL